MDLRARLNAGRVRRGPKPKKQPSGNAPYEREVVLRFGKQWCIFGSPWLQPNAFGRYPESSMPHPQSAERFATLESHVLGTIVQLHEFLDDDKLRELAAENSAFKTEVKYTITSITDLWLMTRRQFINEVNAQRSSGLSAVRNALPKIFRGSEHDIPMDIMGREQYKA